MMNPAYCYGPFDCVVNVLLLFTAAFQKFLLFVCYLFHSYFSGLYIFLTAHFSCKRNPVKWQVESGYLYLYLNYYMAGNTATVLAANASYMKADGYLYLTDEPYRIVWVNAESGAVTIRFSTNECTSKKDINALFQALTPFQRSFCQ